MSEQIKLRGRSAISKFRRQKLIKRVSREVPRVIDIDARFWYFFDVNDFSRIDIKVLEELFDFDINLHEWQNHVFEILVIPRIGTISPWSSKATEIAHVCGLGEIKRVERGIEYIFNLSDGRKLNKKDAKLLASLLFDRMTEEMILGKKFPDLFGILKPQSFKTIEILNDDRILENANVQFGWALSKIEIEYLREKYRKLGRNPSDVELSMFAQANSEHCRHKIFNSTWSIDNEVQGKTLFEMVKSTHRANPKGTVVAYSDNGAIMQGMESNIFSPNLLGTYANRRVLTHTVLKVETHNHPTGISPFSGASTGAGGEIRDEGATGRGAKPKAGLTGFSVSHLRIPGFIQPWESEELKKPSWIASPLEIMLDGPLGSAAFNNEFGRPNLAGYFRSYEMGDEMGIMRGYHKPIMLAGGIGSIVDDQSIKTDFASGTLIVQLGGPGMLIGMGGGAASSLQTGANSEKLDYDSVQRGNPEMQRRAQEVINYCWARGDENPILSVHDVGAGGLSNALPELVYSAKKGAEVALRNIPVEDEGMNPAEIWCNESQERYVIALSPEKLKVFESVCKRERCPYSVIAIVSDQQQLVVRDKLFGNFPVDVALDTILGGLPNLNRKVKRLSKVIKKEDICDITLEDAVTRVLRLPAVADKSFLITINDRSVGGLCSRDSFVGPWQTPVADVAVTIRDFDGYSGECFAIGERGPVAVIDGPASARLAIGEAITNIAAAGIQKLSDVKLSANWMAACDEDGEDAILFDSVKALTTETCIALGISIPVGKDSLSMKTTWLDKEKVRQVTSPMTVVISSFAPLLDVRETLTPQLVADQTSILLLVDLGGGKCRMGGSAICQTYRISQGMPPDLDSPNILKQFFAAIQTLISTSKILAYHDRSDGGLFVTLAEMMFASHIGVDIDLGSSNCSAIEKLFNEELGAVLQIRKKDFDTVLKCFKNLGLEKYVRQIGKINRAGVMSIKHQNQKIFNASGVYLNRLWSETSFKMQELRDNPVCAKAEFDSLLDVDNPGLSVKLSFDRAQKIGSSYISMKKKPKVAILREQGINGQTEMAAAFSRVGFETVDVHMTDLITSKIDLSGYHGLVACGGFSFGDVLGAGVGWGKSILLNKKVRDVFEVFCNRSETFGLGVCNGCQMMSVIKEIIPGAMHWPRFTKNKSEQFESRLVMVEILKSPSVFFKDMEGSQLPIAVAHGEGCVEISDKVLRKKISLNCSVAMRYVDNYGNPTQKYPFNPNGSKGGVTAFTNADGRFTIMMPHPERVFRSVQNSWTDSYKYEFSGWIRMFQNVRKWVD